MPDSANKIDFFDIALSYPLYNYWQTNQDEKDEKERLSIANNDSPAVFLFNEEPYKWETLYQSIVREIYRGDQYSIKAFKLLMETINHKIADKIINDLKKNNIFDEKIIQLINNSSNDQLPNKRDNLRFLKILFAIFTNPYNIEVKRNRKQIYEKTGWLVYRLKKLVSN